MTGPDLEEELARPVERLERADLPFKRQRKRESRRPPFDKKTIALRPDDDQLARLDAWGIRLSDLWRELVVHNRDFLSKSGWPDGQLVRYAQDWRKASPDRRTLPSEGAQNAARTVYQEFGRRLRGLYATWPPDRRLGKAERSEAAELLADLIEERDGRPLHVNRVLVERDRLRVPKLGWLPYEADDVLREVLAGPGNMRVLGARLLKKDGTWRAVLSLERLSEPLITASAKRGKAIADGIYRPEPEWRRVLPEVERVFEEAGQPPALSTPEILDGLKRAAMTIAERKTAAAPDERWQFLPTLKEQWEARWPAEERRRREEWAAGCETIEELCESYGMDLPYEPDEEARRLLLSLNPKRLAALMRTASVGSPRQVQRGGRNVQGYRWVDVKMAIGRWMMQRDGYGW